MEASNSTSNANFSQSGSAQATSAQSSSSSSSIPLADRLWPYMADKPSEATKTSTGQNQASSSKSLADRLWPYMADDYVKPSSSGVSGNSNSTKADWMSGQLLGGDLPESNYVPNNNSPATVAEYSDFSMPQGFEVNSDIMGEFKQQACEMRLTQEQAQRLIDLQVKTQSAQSQAIASQVARWRDEISADPEFGGQRLHQSINDARRVLSAYPEGQVLQEELMRTGYANNPHIIRFLARIGREHYREDSLVTGKAAPVRDKRPLAERLWPNM